MHTDRTGPPDPHALQWLSDRVIGLGAPLTVALRLPRSDAPLLREQVLAQINEHDRQQPLVRSHMTRREIAALEQWQGEHQAWKDMLHGLDSDEGVIELMWPSAYAAPVLNAATAAALAAVVEGAPDAPRLQQRVADLESARATLRAFRAVDNGGLDEVNL